MKEKGKQDQSQLRVSTMVANLDKTGNKMGNMVEPKGTSHGLKNDDASLMLSIKKPKNCNQKFRKSTERSATGILEGLAMTAPVETTTQGQERRFEGKMKQEREAKETLIMGYQIQMRKK